MYNKVLNWYQDRGKFWKVILVGVVVITLGAIVLFQFFSNRVSPSSIFVKKTKEKTDEHVAKYSMTAREEEQKRNDLQKDIDRIEGKKEKAIDSNEKFMEILARDCSTADLKRIETELRKRDRR